MKPWILSLAMLMTLANLDAWAAQRFGGGRSIGKQSTNVTQRATPAPTQPPAAAPAPATAGKPNRPWASMLGGLAAGLGLAWLAHSLGLGEAMGQFLLILLVVLGALALVAWFRRRRLSASPASAIGAPWAYPTGASPNAGTLKEYRPENVGNDAAARPWERKSTAFDASPASPSIIGSALSGKQSWGIPAGFDTEGFLASAKTNFVSLQAAWDKADLATLRMMTTDEMLLEVQAQLAERQAKSGNSQGATEVVMVNAQLLGIEDQGDIYLASVEFSGMMREAGSAGPGPFREVWNMSKAKDGKQGWLVAGIQALH